MIPNYMAQGLAGGRHQELLGKAAQRQLVAALPTGPAGVAPRAHGPLAI